MAGIIEIAIEPGQIQPVLDKANAKKIPVIQVGGGSVPNGDLAGNYGPDETRAGQLLSDEIFKQLGSEGGDVAIQDFPAAWGATRTDAFRKDVKGQDAVKITADYQTDAANLVPFTRKAVADNLTKNPDLKAYWFTFDTTGQVGGQVIQAKYPGKQFPDRPLVTTFHADLGTIELMRKGAIDVTSDVNYDAASWMGIDQMAEFFARGTEPSKENQPDWPGGRRSLHLRDHQQGQPPARGGVRPARVGRPDLLPVEVGRGVQVRLLAGTDGARRRAGDTARRRPFHLTDRCCN